MMDPSFTNWIDSVSEPERQLLIDLAREYSTAVLDSMPTGDRWLITRQLAGVLLCFHGEALGLCSGLPFEARRVVPWEAAATV